MTLRIRPDLLCWGASVALVLTAATQLNDRQQSNGLPLIGVAPSALTSISDDSLDAAVGDIVGGDPFRSNRTTAGPPPVARAPVPAMLVNAPRPRPTVTGIVGGPPWTVVLSGVPGHEDGLVLRQGQLQSGLELRGIRRDTALIRSGDSTWRLTMGRP